MKREIIIAAILLLTVGILINCRTQKRQFSELVHSNVEALSFNEWGGGNDMGGGVFTWYEYHKIDIEIHYCDYPFPCPDTTIYDICQCYVKTCHGYGEYFCNGFINCDGAGV